MNLKTLPLTVIVLFSLAAGSCKKENSDDLQKKADAFKDYLIGKHFIPIEFYADRPIDYDPNDANTVPSTDLTQYIFRYLDDDIITFLSTGFLDFNQGDTPFVPVFPDKEPAPPFKWKVGIIKAKNEVYFEYLDYFYQPRRYTLDHYNANEILAHVPWSDGTKSATLYTRFLKK